MLTTDARYRYCPVLSLFKQHFTNYFVSDPAKHFLDLERHQRKIREIEKPKSPAKLPLAKRRICRRVVVHQKSGRGARTSATSEIQSIRNRIALHETVQEMGL
jgi:hypothetical protein